MSTATSGNTVTWSRGAPWAGGAKVRGCTAPRPWRSTDAIGSWPPGSRRKTANVTSLSCACSAEGAIHLSLGSLAHREHRRARVVHKGDTVTRPFGDVHGRRQGGWSLARGRLSA